MAQTYCVFRRKCLRGLCPTYEKLFIKSSILKFQVFLSFYWSYFFLSCAIKDQNEWHNGLVLTEEYKNSRTQICSSLRQVNLQILVQKYVTIAQSLREAL